MPKTKQVKYTKVFEIDLAIIKLRQAAQKKIKNADQFDKDAIELDGMANNPDEKPGVCALYKRHCETAKKKAGNFRSYANHVLNVRIPKLIQARAALLTAPLPFDEPVEGVVE